MRRLDDLDDTDRKILLYVAAHRDIHGEGPTWREIGEAIGVHRDPASAPHPLYGRFVRLRARHHLWFSHEDRSTDIKGRTRRALGMGKVAS